MMLPSLLLVAGLTAATLVSAHLSAPAPLHAHSQAPEVVAFAGTQPATAMKELTKDDTTDVILEALHQRGINLQGFRGEVTLSDEDRSNGATTSRLGTIVYNAGSGAIRVDFTSLQEDDKPAKKSRQLYALIDGWLTDRNYRTTTESRRQVIRPGEKINLLKLGEGPFPLPIGQEPAEVLKQFDVEPIASDDPRPAIRLIPKEDTKLADKFKKIDVYIDPVTHFPTKIETTSPDGGRIRGTTLSNLQVNPTLTPTDFQLDAIPGSWNRTEDPFKE